MKSSVIRIIAGTLFIAIGAGGALIDLLSGLGSIPSFSACLFAGVGCFILSPRWELLRNLAGAGFLLLFFLQGRATVGSGLAGIGGGLFTMAPLILAAICFSRDLSRQAARPLTGLIDYIYFGNTRCDPPPLTLTLATAYRRELRFDDAIGECERQLEYHPDAASLWREMIACARESGDLRQAKKFLRRACRKLTGENRQAVEWEYGWLTEVDA